MLSSDNPIKNEIHFAYPNVKSIGDEQKWLGCGRFIAYKNDSCPEGYYQNEQPRTTSFSKIVEIQSILAKESITSNKVIIEKKDKIDESYRGQSLDLAYLLALISKIKKLNIDNKVYRGDIWCTGVIDQKGELSLVNVYHDTFEKKFRAFLEQTSDNLFIAPASNFNSKIRDLCEKNNIKFLDLVEAKEIDPNKLLKQKAVLLIYNSDLKTLINYLFESVDNKTNIEISKNVKARIFANNGFFTVQNFQLNKNITWKIFVKTIANAASVVNPKFKSLSINSNDYYMYDQEKCKFIDPPKIMLTYKSEQIVIIHKDMADLIDKDYLDFVLSSKENW